MEALSDDALMQQVRDGHPGTLAVLFERHHQSLFRFFYHLTNVRDLSEDLVQDVFFRLLKFRHTYRSGTQFTSWMYQIARNAHVDHLRKRKGERQMEDVEEGPARDLPSREPVPELQVKTAQEVRLLRRALAALPLEKRELLVMSRFQELKYEQIAQVLQVEVSTVKVRVFRAVRELGEVYRELAGEKAS